LLVIPAKAGIQFFALPCFAALLLRTNKEQELDSGLRRNDEQKKGG